MKRLRVAGAQPGTLSLSGPSFHYLRRVLRVAPDEVLEVFDGAGRSFSARVLTVTESGVTLELGAATLSAPGRVITIVQGMPKADKLELVLQKGTELGASRFIAVDTERAVVKLERNVDTKLTRWRRIVEEAARQCRRNDVPEVRPPAPLLDAVRALPDAPLVLVLDEEEHTLPLGAAFATVLESSRAVALVIGPEGGLARGEVEALRSLGALSVSLGSLVLRTETAALAALSVLRHLDGALA